ncbi:hypothetical protein SAMN05216243_2148 [Sediminibacillus albus]|uniref:Uncharacterized protein n=1 Tax=Sediminibacillus albus TaxID=407036 RepID=A0A1G8ZR07_9BACI|nr:hypothetical protein SAMN05216243_2148 [Sediminibacillus albus]
MKKDWSFLGPVLLVFSIFILISSYASEFKASGIILKDMLKFSVDITQKKRASIVVEVLILYIRFLKLTPPFV